MHTTTFDSAVSSGSRLRTVAFAVAGSVLLAASAHVAVPLPWTPVPMTLQTFAVILLALTLGPVAASGAAVAYLLEGAAGLPVFQPHGPGGVAQLFGVTGGFLLSYPVVAYVGGMLARGKASFLRYASACAVMIAMTLSCGAVWFSILGHASLATALALTVTPFLAGEAVKMIAAAGIATTLQRDRN